MKKDSIKSFVEFCKVTGFPEVEQLKFSEVDDMHTVIRAAVLHHLINLKK